MNQLSLHEFRVHGIKDSVRLRVPFTYCLVCLVEFHTRERILNHIRYRSQSCRYNLMLRNPVLSDHEADKIESDLSLITTQNLLKNFALKNYKLIMYYTIRFITFFIDLYKEYILIFWLFLFL